MLILWSWLFPKNSNVIDVIHFCRDSRFCEIIAVLFFPIFSPKIKLYTQISPSVKTLAVCCIHWRIWEEATSIFFISCSFWENLPNSCFGKLEPPPKGNTGSAPGISSMIYLIELIIVFL